MFVFKTKQNLTKIDFVLCHSFGSVGRAEPREARLYESPKGRNPVRMSRIVSANISDFFTSRWFSLLSCLEELEESSVSWLLMTCSSSRLVHTHDISSHVPPPQPPHSEKNTVGRDGLFHWFLCDLKNCLNSSSSPRIAHWRPLGLTTTPRGDMWHYNKRWGRSSWWAPSFLSWDKQWKQVCRIHHSYGCKINANFCEQMLALLSEGRRLQ